MELEGKENIEEKSQSNKNRFKTDSISNSKTRDYSLYRTFWNIQVFINHYFFILIFLFIILYSSSVFTCF